MIWAKIITIGDFLSDVTQKRACGWNQLSELTPACQSEAAGKHVSSGNPFLDARLKHSGMTDLINRFYFDHA